MGRTTRIGLFCLLVSLGVLLLASSRGVTDPALGLPAVVSGLVLGAGLALDRRTRRTHSATVVNWAEEFTARVRSERAAARGEAGTAPVDRTAA
jgi:hypothetical protein